MRNISADTVHEAILNQTVHEMLKKKYDCRPQKRMKLADRDTGKDYFSFIIVRHPFVRLVSAFSVWLRVS